MKGGTAIGLLVGGAVLLLATRGARASQPVAAPGGNLNPLNWLNSLATGNPFAGGAAPQLYVNPNAAPPSAAQLGNSIFGNPGFQAPNLQNSLFSGGGSLINAASYSPAYSYGGYGYGSGAYAAGYSPYPVPTASGDATGYDFFPVMTPGGGFQDYSQLAANSQGNWMTASSPNAYLYA